MVALATVYRHQRIVFCNPFCLNGDHLPWCQQPGMWIIQPSRPSTLPLSQFLFSFVCITDPHAWWHFSCIQAPKAVWRQARWWKPTFFLILLLALHCLRDYHWKQIKSRNWGCAQLCHGIQCHCKIQWKPFWLASHDPHNDWVARGCKRWRMSTGPVVATCTTCRLPMETMLFDCDKRC